MTGIQDYHAREHLLAVLKERGILLGSDDVAWAFSSPKTRDETIAWVKEYLQVDTLLSNDEIELFQEISSSRALQRDDDGAIVVHDSQLSDALEALQASTNMIEQHTRTLEKQRDALEAMRRQAEDRRNALVSQSPGRSRKLETGSRAFIVDETALSLEEDFNIAFKHSNRATYSLNSLTSERLGADDEVLAALSKLAPKTMSHSSEGTTIEKIEQWTRALSAMREQEANARIDTMINQNILELVSTGQHTNGADEILQKEEIESELKSLRDEIGSVVDLVVGSEFHQPLSRLLRNSKGQSQNSQHEWLGYVLATMEHMIRQVDEMSLCASDIRSYNNALAEIHSAFSSIADAPQGDKKMTQTSNNAPSVANDARRGVDSRSTASSTNLADQVFRRFGISGRMEGASLETACEIGISKLQAQYSSAANSTAEVVGKSLEEQRKELQLVLKQLYAFSEFSSVQLLPKDVEEAVQGLDDAIGETVVTLSSAESGNHDDVRRGIAKLRDRLHTK